MPQETWNPAYYAWYCIVHLLAVTAMVFALSRIRDRKRLRLILGNICEAEQMEGVSRVLSVFQQVPKKIVDNIVEHGKHALRDINHHHNIDTGRPEQATQAQQDDNQYQCFLFHVLLFR